MWELQIQQILVIKCTEYEVNWQEHADKISYDRTAKEI
jgi:hypothetical protein